MVRANGQSNFENWPSGIKGQIKWPVYSKNSIYRNSFARSHSLACHVSELCGLASKYSAWDGGVGDEPGGEELGQIVAPILAQLTF